MEYDAQLYNRVRRLPDKVENAYRKLRELEAEAQALGAKDIKHELSVVNRAWDREIQAAQIKVASVGGECSMGVDEA